MYLVGPRPGGPGRSLALPVALTDAIAALPTRRAKKCAAMRGDEYALRARLARKEAQLAKLLGREKPQYGAY
jgi:hypothetical protein